MFERRLRILLLLFALPVLAVVARLVQLQVVRGGTYQSTAEKLLLNEVTFFPCLRGMITDHRGQRLAYDAPSWNICVRYGALVRDRDYLRSVAREMFPDLPPEEQMERLDQEIALSWQRISSLTNTPMADIEKTCAATIEQVQLIKRIVSERRKVQTEVLEERMAHPIVKGLNQLRQVEAREALRAYPWIEIVSDQTRRYAGGPAVGHLLGRLTQVGKADLETNPYENEPYAELLQYRPGDLRGSSGVEAMAERWLRGRRGRRQEDKRKQVVGEAVDPVNGRDFRLTIDLTLQQRIYELLSRTVEATPHSTGGSVVLLDVPTREVRVMVNYPSHDPNISWRDMIQLAGDTVREPTSLRAIQTHYPPGSTVKPMLLAAAVADGLVNASSTVTCEGALFPGIERWRCTGHHGTVQPVFAVQHSCNIFFYRLGEQIGVGRLNHWMEQFGLGRPTGIGLPQEAPGHLPTETSAGQARLAGIGQGMVDATPMQVANMMATLATGTYRPVTLWADDPSPRPGVRLAIPDGAWRLAREGMYRTVHALGGTAYKAFHDADLELGEYVILGKTGSATANRKIVERLYTCHFPDGATREVTARSREQVERQFPEATIVGGRAATLWPPPDVEPTHAWFAGYVTSRDRYLDSGDNGDCRIAFAVIIEYGGHGGTGAAPLAFQAIREALAWHRGRQPAPQVRQQHAERSSGVATASDERRIGGTR